MQHRNAFTLVELLVVISVIILLTVMTIGAIDLTRTGERIRSGARAVQSKLEGAKDRAIYAGDLRGVRLLVNEDILEDHDSDPSTPDIATICTAIAYIGATGSETSEEFRTGINAGELRKYVTFPDLTVIGPGGFYNMPLTDPVARVIIGTNTNWTDLHERGLLGPESFIEVEGCRYKIDPRSFPVKRENSAYVAGGFGGLNGFTSTGARLANGLNPDTGAQSDDEILYLLWSDDCLPPVTATPAATNDRWPWRTEPRAYSIELAPDILPGETVLQLPRNACIDLQTSVLPPSWTVYNSSAGTQFSSKMDLLFSPSGAITSELGIVHLHVTDIGDAMLNTPAGSLVKADGTNREGDELGVTVFTRSGRVNTHPMDVGSNPWRLAIEGEVAK